MSSRVLELALALRGVILPHGALIEMPRRVCYRFEELLAQLVVPVAVRRRALRVDPLQELREAADGVAANPHVTRYAQLCPKFVHFPQFTASDRRVIRRVEVLQCAVAILEVLVVKDSSQVTVTNVLINESDPAFALARRSLSILSRWAPPGRGGAAAAAPPMSESVSASARELPDSSVFVAA
eukprot:CAMPEP_0184404296 /NCGR_PEP_ID=MMETSP0007-20130409/85860_1 /TAXON_ID=97485 /ORGANISM="Prymnesium parvum, Strain Texoma1" /LENGTH=182 /DNA_ID=CAMNT_0026760439 /DNA_START=862 /DNA_END=1411 /DNA_ORIENTATION=-